MFAVAQQVPAHRPQRVAASASVATEFGLASAAHRGERLRGESLHVEPVRHPGRVRCQVPHGGLVAGVGVDHPSLDGSHTVAERLQAADEGFLGPALDEVPQPRRVQIHQAGHEAPVATERGLVDAQAPRRTRRQPGDLAACGGDDRPPRRGPAHHERARHRRSRPVPGGPGHRHTQPGRHTTPRRDLARGLGERADAARRLAAKPPLGPYQHRRALKAQTVAHPAGPILLDPPGDTPQRGQAASGRATRTDTSNPPADSTAPPGTHPQYECEEPTIETVESAFGLDAQVT